MINKESHGFNTFAANRIGEVHRNTKKENWYWIEGELNIADITSRGCRASELRSNSIWQNGPDFLRLPESDWPILQDTNITVLPEEKKRYIVSTVTTVTSTSLVSAIDIERFSKLSVLLNTTARILKLYARFRRNGNRLDKEILPEDVSQAANLWIKNAQEEMAVEIKKGRYKKLNPTSKDGIVVVAGRMEEWMKDTWNNQYFILLPKGHRLSYLIALSYHQSSGHLGVSSTIAVIRSKYWIIGVRRIVSSIISKCVKCKIKFKRLESQKMCSLPIERIKPSPAFSNVAIDYFGPFAIKGEVQKRVRGKGYAILITCDASRAVYVDLAPDYSTSSLLLALRRFSSFRGWPRHITSDPGSQLKSASVELQETIKSLDWNELIRFGHQKGFIWNFSPADAPWYNGSVEALVKTVKRALSVTIGEHVFTFSEFLTVLFEVAELVNERTIGVKPTSPDDCSLHPMIFY